MAQTPNAGKKPPAKKETGPARKGHPLMTFEELINQVCAERGWPYRRTGENAVEVEIALDKGRKQKVTLETYEEEDETLTRVKTIIGPADSLSLQQTNAALGMNAHMRFGAFAIDSGNLCLVDSYLLRDADPDEVAESVRFLGRQGDFCEKYVYRQDKH
ncbi:MAG: hypothetical protein HYY93_16550 [Planctomycetes bacterium]|nr:hypothetical protein [Planctomycetota bacterium]